MNPNKDLPDIIIIHGGNSYKNHEEYIEATKNYSPRFRDGYRDWKTNIIFELEGLYNVYCPIMPCKDNAKFSEWKIVFEKVLAMVDSTKPVTFVGHSLGANFLQSYLGSHKLDYKLTELHFISGCISEGDFAEAVDWQVVSSQTEQTHIWHSTDDTVVPYEEALYYNEKLPDSVLHTLKGKNHLTMPYFPQLTSHFISLLQQ